MCIESIIKSIHFPNIGIESINYCHVDSFQYHDRRDIILTSQMAVSNNFITVTVIQNIPTWFHRPRYKLTRSMSSYLQEYTLL